MSSSSITFKNLSLNQLNSSINFLYLPLRYQSSRVFSYLSVSIILTLRRFEELLFVTFLSAPRIKCLLLLEFIASPLSCKNLLRLEELGDLSNFSMTSGLKDTSFDLWYLIGTPYYLLCVVDLSRERYFLLACSLSTDLLYILLFWLSFVSILDDFSDKM